MAEAPLPDADALLAQRSPGARADGALARAKKRLLADAKRPIFQRVLSGARPPRTPTSPVTDPPWTAFGIDDPIAVPQPLPISLAQIGSLPALDESSGRGIGPFPGPGGPIGGGGIIAPTQPEAGTEPPVVLPPVPEPRTWILMITGFALVGFGLRRSAGRVARQIIVKLVGPLRLTGPSNHPRL